MPKPLPSELEYLKPTIEYFSGLSQDEIEEGVLDTTLLEQAFLARADGLSATDGQRLLDEDMAALKAWLGESGADDSPEAFYIREWAAEVGSDLVEIIRAPPCTDSPFENVHYEPPMGYTIDEMGWLCLTDSEIFSGCIWKSSWFDSCTTRLQFGGKPPKDYKGKQSKSKVSFGPVTGHKMTFIDGDPVPWTRIEYVLKVPGGHVKISMQYEDSNFDELPLEQSFHTLRIVK